MLDSGGVGAADVSGGDVATWDGVPEVQMIFSICNVSVKIEEALLRWWSTHSRDLFAIGIFLQSCQLRLDTIHQPIKIGTFHLSKKFLW